MKKIVVISDSFKGTLGSEEICDIAERVIPQELPGCEVVALPVADGGEGTVAAFVRAIGAKTKNVKVRGAYGIKGGAISDETDVIATYAVCDSLDTNNSTAIIEMAAAAGLPSVQDRKNPELTTTYGVGQIIKAAIDEGARDILLGVGGSATTDGGCGMAAALGTKFFDAAGKSFIPVGGTLKDIAHIDNSEAEAFLKGISITVMCDVTNPMYGPTGAAYIFGPQKGADTEMIVRLDNGLKSLAEVIKSDLGKEVADMPGAGAAGAMGAGAVAMLGAQLKSGIEAVLDIIDFDRQLVGADLVITGEGQIDDQSVHGKVISGIAARTEKAGVTLYALVGGIGKDLLDNPGIICHKKAYLGELKAYGLSSPKIDAIFTTNIKGLPFEEILSSGCTPKDYEETLRAVLKY